MGAYQIFHIIFKTKQARDSFEKCYDKIEYDNQITKISKPRRLCQYKYGEEFEVTYFMGWDGYGLARMCLDYLHKNKLIPKIKKFRSLDLSCSTNWYNELKPYRDELKCVKLGLDETEKEVVKE